MVVCCIIIDGFAVVLDVKMLKVMPNSVFLIDFSFDGG